MLDGAEDGESYPSDFFVELVFSRPAEIAETEEEKKSDQFWGTIAELCAKRRAPSPIAKVPSATPVIAPAKREEKPAGPMPEPQQDCFVIDDAETPGEEKKA